MAGIDKRRQQRVCTGTAMALLGAAVWAAPAVAAPPGGDPSDDGLTARERQEIYEALPPPPPADGAMWNATS